MIPKVLRLAVAGALISLVWAAALAEQATFTVGTASASRPESDRSSRGPRRLRRGARNPRRRGPRREAGAVLALVAGAHGTEYASIVAIEKLIERLDPAEVSGRSSSLRSSTFPLSSRRFPTSTPWTART